MSELKPPPPKGSGICPFHRQDLSKVCASCPLYTRLRGRDPQTGDMKDQWGCSFAWLPMLLIENSQETRQQAAAFDKLRGELVGVTGATGKMLADALERIGGESAKIINGAAHSSRNEGDAR